MRTRESFSEPPVDKSPSGSVLVRSCGMHHNYYFHESQGASTAVLVGDCGQPGGLVHNLRHNNVERPVQSAEGTSQPLDLDGHGAPLLLEAVALPLIDRLGQVERVAIPEVEPSPPHPDSVEPRTKTVGDVLRHAARIIEENGWWGFENRDRSRSSEALCAWQAILFSSLNSGGDEEASCALMDSLEGPSKRPGATRVWKWNDTPGRTAAEVIAALRAAADEADRG